MRSFPSFSASYLQLPHYSGGISNTDAVGEIIGLIQETFLISGHTIDFLLLARGWDIILTISAEPVALRTCTSGWYKRVLIGVLCPRGYFSGDSRTLRDSGLAPSVIKDHTHPQNNMCSTIPVVEPALLVSSTRHSVATDNLLSATALIICVDVNPFLSTEVTN